MEVNGHHDRVFGSRGGAPGKIHRHEYFLDFKCTHFHHADRSRSNADHWAAGLPDQRVRVSAEPACQPCFRAAADDEEIRVGIIKQRAGRYLRRRRWVFTRSLGQLAQSSLAQVLPMKRVDGSDSLTEQDYRALKAA